MYRYWLQTFVECHGWFYLQNEPANTVFSALLLKYFNFQFPLLAWGLVCFKLKDSCIINSNKVIGFLSHNISMYYKQEIVKVVEIILNDSLLVLF